MHNNLVKFSAALGLLAIFALPALAFAQTQISVGIPGSNLNNTSTAPGAYIANFYQFALLIGGILAFGAIVFGGVKYVASAGNPSAQSDGKEWIWGALLGLLLLAGAYLILKVINPQLLNLNPATLSAINAATNTTAPGNSTPPPASTTSSTCPAVTSPGSLCTTSSLANTCFSGNTALWSGICKNESQGQAALKSGSDNCLGPNGTGLYPVSVGLFQINLTNSWKQTVDGQNCSAAFIGQAISCPNSSQPCTTGSKGSGKSCQISNGQCGSESCLQLYNDCVSAAQNGAANITVACTLSSNGSNLGPWKADANKCGF
jgi:hypothetical protein